MALEFKDYYATLGVARGATQDEIRKSFRALARKYHPDVAADKAHAEERFKEINEAYEVLGDPERRRRYDELGANWRDGGEAGVGAGPGPRGRGRRSGGGPASGAEHFEFGGTGFSDFFEQFFGAGMRDGAGFRGSTGPEWEEAGSLDVEADLMVTLEEALRGVTRSLSMRRRVKCPACGGHRRGNVCPDCGGSGLVEQLDSFRVRVPAGVREGQRVRVARKGESGGGGGSGDLYLRIRFSKHPDFEVDGPHLRTELFLAPWEAVLGTEVVLRCLEGEVRVRIPAGTRQGQTIRVANRGLTKEHGGRGDLLALVRIQVPERVTAKERELWEALARESGRGEPSAKRT